MSWESPIEIIVNQIESAWMDETFRVIQKVGINVDRNELIKALQYDRNQYEKGYEDGINGSQIIRCKDCKYRDVDGYCQVLGDMFIHWEDWTPVPDDFFCARGTRS